MSSLDSLRRRGLRSLVGMGWLCIPSLLILGRALSSPNIGFAVAVAAAANVVPTIMVLRRRHDAAARLSVASSASTSSRRPRNKRSRSSRVCATSTKPTTA